jgi:hypothetical protein
MSFYILPDERARHSHRRLILSLAGGQGTVRADRTALGLTTYSDQGAAERVSCGDSVMAHPHPQPGAIVVLTMCLLDD